MNLQIIWNKLLEVMNIQNQQAANSKTINELPDVEPGDKLIAVWNVDTNRTERQALQNLSNQDNIRTETIIDCPEDTSTDGFTAALNALPLWETADTQIPSFKAISSSFPAITYYIEIKGIGKGLFGTGGTQLFPDNIAVKAYFSTITDIISTGPQIIELPDTAGTVAAALTSASPGILIQDPSAGYVLVNISISGSPYSYLFTGPGGTYGVGGLPAEDYMFQLVEHSVAPYSLTVKSRGVTYGNIKNINFRNKKIISDGPDGVKVYELEVLERSSNFTLTANQDTSFFRIIDSLIITVPDGLPAYFYIEGYVEEGKSCTFYSAAMTILSKNSLVIPEKTYFKFIWLEPHVYVLDFQQDSNLNNKPIIIPVSLADLGLSEFGDLATMKTATAAYYADQDYPIAGDEIYLMEITETPPPNFDITGDWSAKGVTNKSNFISYMHDDDGLGTENPDLTVTNFLLIDGRLTANVTNMVDTHFEGMSITSIDALPNSIINLRVQNNLLTSINCELPSALEGLGISQNQLTTCPTLPPTVTIAFLFSNHFSTATLDALADQFLTGTLPKQNWASMSQSPTALPSAPKQASLTANVTSGAYF